MQSTTYRQHTIYWPTRKLNSSSHSFIIAASHIDTKLKQNASRQQLMIFSAKLEHWAIADLRQIFTEMRLVGFA